MIMACNPARGDHFKGGISLDSNPGNLFVQFNNDYTGVNWADLSDNTLPFTISTGTWYTMQTQVIFSPAASAVSFYIKLWPKNNPTNVASVTFFDNVTVDPGFIMPTCSGGWRAGWQADETAGTDWYSNLKIFGPGPVVNSTIYDPIPAGVSYVSIQLDARFWSANAGMELPGHPIFLGYSPELVGNCFLSWAHCESRLRQLAFYTCHQLQSGDPRHFRGLQYVANQYPHPDLYPYFDQHPDHDQYRYFTTH